MNILILGSKTHSIADIGRVILHTDDPVKIQPAINAAAAEGFVRFTKLVNPLGIPVFPTAAAKSAAPAPEAPAAPPAEDEAAKSAKSKSAKSK